MCGDVLHLSNTITQFLAFFFPKKKLQPVKFDNYLVNVGLRLDDNKTSVIPPEEEPEIHYSPAKNTTLSRR